MRYDLVVIGSGPGGQKAAIAASKLGKRVAIVERAKQLVGGVCLHTGTIPSKTIREAILHLTGFRQRGAYPDLYRNKRQITMDELRRKLAQVSRTEWEVLQDQFDRNGVEVHVGEATFVDRQTIRIGALGEHYIVHADKVILAPGTQPSRPNHIPFDGTTVFDSDEFLNLEHIPRSMVVVGAGVIGIEYGLMFATLGVKVTLIDGRPNLLEFCDREIIDVLVYHARSLGVTLRLGEAVENIHKLDEGSVAVELASGKRIVGETVLFSVGRQGDTAALNVEAAGLKADKRGRLSCDENFQTEVPSIYAVGDIVGFPSLASASMEQGRQAASHAFKQPFTPSDSIPYGLFTVPEISMVGKNEEELTKECVPYETGVARFSEIARGQIVGDTTGLLKLLFHRETLHLLGVHCIGDTATEIVHIGQAVMRLGGTIEYFRDTVFNYPTMAECYKVAALDGLNKVRLAYSPSPKPAESFCEPTRTADAEADATEAGAPILAPLSGPPLESPSTPFV